MKTQNVKNNYFKCKSCEHDTCSKAHLQSDVKQVHEKIRSHQCPYCKFSASENVSDLGDSNRELQEFAKQLKAQKPSGDTKKELETSKKVVSPLNQQLSNMMKKIIDQSSKIKELESSLGSLPIMTTY